MSIADRVARADCRYGCVKDMIATQADATIAAKDAEIAKYREALAPFAEIADHFPKHREFGNRPWEGVIYAWRTSGFPDAEMTVEHVHAARAALESK